MRRARTVLDIVRSELLVRPELAFGDCHVFLREYGVCNHEHPAARLRSEGKPFRAAERVERSVIPLGDQLHACLSEIGEYLLRVRGDAVACHERQIRTEIIAAPTLELVQHVVRPVLRTGLVAVHDDAFKRQLFRLEAVDYFFRVGVPVQFRGFGAHFVALETHCVRTSVLCSRTGRDGYEAKDLPMAFRQLAANALLLFVKIVRDVDNAPEIDADRRAFARNEIHYGGCLRLPVRNFREGIRNGLERLFAIAVHSARMLHGARKPLFVPGIFEVGERGMGNGERDGKHGDGLLPASVFLNRQREDDLSARRIAVDAFEPLHSVSRVDPRSACDVAVADGCLERKTETRRFRRGELDSVPPSVAPEFVGCRILAVVLVVIDDAAEPGALERLCIRRNPLARRLRLTEEPPRLRTALVRNIRVFRLPISVDGQCSRTVLKTPSSVGVNMSTRGCGSANHSNKHRKCNAGSAQHTRNLALSFAVECHFTLPVIGSHVMTAPSVAQTSNSESSVKRISVPSARTRQSGAPSFGTPSRNM